MKFLRLALTTLVVSSITSAWNCDDRCPEYEKCLQDERDKGNSRVLEEDMNASVANKQNLRRERQLDQLGETYFLLKMHHEESTEYCWQSEFEDRGWCMACESCEGCSFATCDEGDALWIQFCNDDKDEQYLVYEAVSDGGRLKPYTAQYLCLEWTGPGSKTMSLQPCEDDNTAQILVGFNMYSPFELHPYGYDPSSTDSPLCLSQAHHPKKEEKIKAYDCEKTRDDRTSLWQVYEAVVDGETLGLATPEPTFAPTEDDVYTPYPTVSPVESTSNEPLLTDYGTGECTPESPCGHCEGDCNSDFDCFGDYECFHRAYNEEVPSCRGGGDIDNRK